MNSQINHILFILTILFKSPTIGMVLVIILSWTWTNGMLTRTVKTNLKAPVHFQICCMPIQTIVPITNTSEKIYLDIIYALMNHLVSSLIFVGMTALWTISSQKRKLFVVGTSICLITENLDWHQVIDTHGPVAFLEITQLCSFDQSCCRNVVGFQMRRGDNWKFGIVQSTFPMDPVPHANIFVWTGTLEIPGTPTFATVMGYKKWTDITHYFHLKQFKTEKIELLFVNQVQGLLKS